MCYRVVSGLGEDRAGATKDGVDCASTPGWIVQEDVGDGDRRSRAGASVVRKDHVVAIVGRVESELAVGVRGEGIGEGGDAVVGIDGGESAAMQIHGYSAKGIGAFDDGSRGKASGDYLNVALLRESGVGLNYCTPENPGDAVPAKVL